MDVRLSTRSARVGLLLCVLVLLTVASGRAQTTQAQSPSTPKLPPSNPLEGDATAIRAGGARFQTVCAECHGTDGKGIFGPDLTTLWLLGATDERVFRTIRSGVPNSSMPPQRMGDDEIWSVVAYLRTLAPKVAPPTVAGDARNGERLFRINCISCHRVNGRGGRLGPDLSRIGSARSREGLLRDIRNASAVLVPGYKGVTLQTADGRTIKGAVKGEDAFSIRIMDTREQLQAYLKADLKAIVPDERSLMPDFGEDRLSGKELDDLLQYLGTLRPAAAR